MTSRDLLSFSEKEENLASRGEFESQKPEDRRYKENIVQHMRNVRSIHTVFEICGSQEWQVFASQFAKIPPLVYSHLSKSCCMCSSKILEFSYPTRSIRQAVAPKPKK